MTDWHAQVIANTGPLTPEQQQALADAGPGYTVVTHHEDTGHTTLAFTLEAGTLRQATDAAYKAASETINSTLGTKHSVALVGARLDTVADYERELMNPRELELVGNTEGAQLLNVTRQRFEQLATGHSAFPKAAATLARGKVYRKEAILAFKEIWESTTKTNRKGGRPRKNPQ